MDTTQAISAALYDASNRYIPAIMQDAAFQALLAKQDIGPADRHHARYWTTFAEFAPEYVQQERLDSPDGMTPVTAEAAILLAQTARFLFVQQRLTANDEGTHEYDDWWFKKADKTLASEYDRAVRTFGLHFPEVSVQALTMTLQGMAEYVHGSGEQQERDAQEIANVIRGAQHELGYRQIAEYMPAVRSVQPTTTQEDLHGVDLIVTLDHGEVLYLDVKSSENTVRKVSGNGEFGVRRGERGEHDVIEVFSQLSGTDFDDHFSVPDEIARARAPHAADILSQAHNHLHDRRRHHHRYYTER